MRRLALTLSILPLATVASVAQNQVRVKDVATTIGVRTNYLIGYGLAMGLNGTGDSLRNAPFTQQSIQSMLDRLGLNVRSAQLRTRNIAAVIVTAELPAFASLGSRIDVTVASMGDATSLAGGNLLMTPLRGADETIYAVAQGAIAVSGFQVGGKSETVTQGVPTAGRIANGALVERELPAAIAVEGPLALELRNPDFKTAVHLADVINVYSKQRFGHFVARERDLRVVQLRKPASISTARFLAEIGELAVRPDVPARVVIDERAGTIIIGKDVQISTVAVSHGNLNIRVTETPRVSQPQPFSEGKTVVSSETQVDVNQSGGAVGVVQGTSLQMLVMGLNRMGLKPSGIIAVLQAIKTAGALHAELVVQ
mgnify:CR=1 FL=1